MLLEGLFVACAVHGESLRGTDLTDTRSGWRPDVVGAGPGQIAGIAEHGIDNQRL